MGTENDENVGKVKKSRTEATAIKVQGIDPNYLQKYVAEDISLDSLKEHRIVPRLKIIQAPSSNELKKAFGEGSVIVRPGDVLVCKFQEEPESFDFVPLFFFVEYVKWADMKDNSTTVILDRSHDPTSNIALKAKNPASRMEPYPGHENKPEPEKMYHRYVEHLRFIGIIYGNHPLVGVPVTLSFERGEYGQGKNFISAATLRRQIIDGISRPVPLWAQVWKIRSAFRSPDQSRKWYGFNFEAADPSIVQSTEAETMLTLHKEFKDLFEQQRLMVQEESGESTADAGAVSAQEAF
jgi:hypothetical protein